MENKERKIAILIPCYNEAISIAKVIRDFKKELPFANIYVYDNNSSDNTARIARENGAIVKRESKQGKGNVIRSMFRDIEADIYVMVDGDDTYPPEAVHELIALIDTGEADMVIGDRHSSGAYHDENKRRFHSFGNQLVKRLINFLFATNLEDIMSGYRAFNREFVKHIPIHSSGFEIETEISMHALDKNFHLHEIPIAYRDRCDGSVSKLNTLSDGIKVLKTIFWLFKDYKPLAFFTLLSIIFFILSLLIGIPVVYEFMLTGFIDKIPSAILSVGLMLISIMALFAGFILDTIVKQHREHYEFYLRNAKDKLILT